MKKSEVLELVAALRDRFPKAGKEFSARNAAAYCEDLIDLEFSTSVAAVRRLAATVQWFPSIAEIRSAYADIAVPTPDPDEAWKEALQYGRKNGWGRELAGPREVVEVHPAVKDAVEGLGGWRQLGQSTSQEIDRAHFIKLYSSSRARYRDKTISQPLIEETQRKLLRGQSEENQSEGEESENTRRLGRR